MPRVSEAYCQPEDINLGDIDLPRDTTIETWIKATADEIDASLGQKYQLPFSFDPSKPQDRADALLLSKINKFLAMGRLLCTISSAHEGAELHAYGKSLIGDAKAEISRIMSGTVVLESLTLVTDPNVQYDGPMILNKDAESFVDSFYRSSGTAHQPHTEWGAPL